MGLLSKQLKEKHKEFHKIAAGAVTNAVACPTGFSLIDAASATLCTNIDTKEDFVEMGLPFGKITTFVGNSLSGKTTLAEQVAYNMVKDLGGDIVIADYERSSHNLARRFMNITGCTLEEYKDTVTVYSHLGMSTEFFKKLIFDIVEIKKSLGKDSFVDWVDVDGRDIKIYPPTVVILDSIPAMKPEEVLNNNDLDNNMVPAKMAAANSSLFKTILNVLEAYNITLFTINHITTKVVTNMYAPRKVIIPGLGEDENLPGGNSCAYLPSFIIRLTSGSELKAEKDMCDGRVTALRLLKNRLGFSNTRVNMVLEANSGFHNGITLFQYAKENKLLTGGKGAAGYNFDTNPLPKGFTQKQFLALYEENQEFREAFTEFVEDSIMASTTLRKSEKVEANEVEFEDEFEE